MPSTITSPTKAINELLTAVRCYRPTTDVGGKQYRELQIKFEIANQSVRAANLSALPPLEAAGLARCIFSDIPTADDTTVTAYRYDPPGSLGVEEAWLARVETIREVCTRSGKTDRQSSTARRGAAKELTNNQPGRRRNAESPDKTERLLFDKLELTITLDGTPHKIDDPQAYYVYKTIAEEGVPITMSRIQTKVKGCQGKKKIPALIQSLPAPIERTVRRDHRGYWIDLSPAKPNGRKKGNT